MTTQETPGIGHNKPPAKEELTALSDRLAQRIADENTDLKKRKDDLIARAAELPKKVKSEDHVGKIGDFIRDVDGVLKDAEAIRVATKAPVLLMERAIDGIFKKFGKPLTDLTTELRGRINVYQVAKDEEERQRREAEAEKARKAEDEARAKAAKALKGKNQDKAADAVRAVDHASAQRAQAEAAVDFKPAEVARTRGEQSTSTLQEVWHSEVTDWDKLQSEGIAKLGRYISRSELEKAAERAAKDMEASGIGAIPGVRIYSTKETKVL